MKVYINARTANMGLATAGLNIVSFASVQLDVNDLAFGYYLQLWFSIGFGHQVDVIKSPPSPSPVRCCKAIRIFKPLKASVNGQNNIWIDILLENMIGFKITTKDNKEIKFIFYLDTAPVTAKAFAQILPFSRVFYHAKLSGKEIWIDNVPSLDIIQENASVFTEPGEVVVGPQKPTRTKTANCLGVYYGDGKGLDACNIFAKVADNDMQKLIDLGNKIWKSGSQELIFSLID